MPQSDQVSRDAWTVEDQDSDAESMVSTYHMLMHTISKHDCISMHFLKVDSEEDISASRLLSRTCSQIPAMTDSGLPRPIIEMEAVIDLLRLNKVPVPDYMLDIMEMSFRDIKNMLEAAGIPCNRKYLRSDRSGVLEDSLSLIINDIVHGTHSL